MSSLTDVGLGGILCVGLRLGEAGIDRHPAAFVAAAVDRRNRYAGDRPGNRIVAEAVNKARESVRQGESLMGPLAESPVFPPMVTRMIGIGEKTGSLETLLEKISEFYDEQVSATVKQLTSLIEPIMIVILGVVIGGLVVAMYLPIFRLVTLIK